MTKSNLKKLIRWIESEDYQDFSDNFDTFERRFNYINEKFNDHQDIMSEVVGKIKTKSVIELFPDADVSIPTEELADQVMYKEAYNDGIREAQNIIRAVLVGETDNTMAVYPPGTLSNQ